MALFFNFFESNKTFANTKLFKIIKFDHLSQLDHRVHASPHVEDFDNIQGLHL